jgi:hypothetical protein
MMRLHRHGRKVGFTFEEDRHEDSAFLLLPVCIDHVLKPR